MTITAVPSRTQRREQVRANAAAMGVDEAYISTLVETFYSRIRQDETLGPIFNKAIGENWEHHLFRMKHFWASVALNSGTYSGKPVPAHKKHTSIKQEHFAIWLTLFERTLRETAATPQAVDYFMERAKRIAESLQLAMFGSPGLEFLLNHE